MKPSRCFDTCWKNLRSTRLPGINGGSSISRSVPMQNFCSTACAWRDCLRNDRRPSYFRDLRRRYRRLFGGDEESPIAAFRAHLLANELPLMRKRVNSLTDREWPRFHPTEPIRLASTNDPNGAN